MCIQCILFIRITTDLDRVKLRRDKPVVVALALVISNNNDEALLVLADKDAVAMGSLEVQIRCSLEAPGEPIHNGELFDRSLASSRTFMNLYMYHKSVMEFSGPESFSLHSSSWGLSFIAMVWYTRWPS